MRHVCGLRHVIVIASTSSSLQRQMRCPPPSRQRRKINISPRGRGVAFPLVPAVCQCFRHQTPLERRQLTSTRNDTTRSSQLNTTVAVACLNVKNLFDCRSISIIDREQLFIEEQINYWQKRLPQIVNQTLMWVVRSSLTDNSGNQCALFVLLLFNDLYLYRQCVFTDKERGGESTDRANKRRRITKNYAEKIVTIQLHTTLWAIKNRATLFLIITPAFLGWFLCFLYQ